MGRNRSLIVWSAIWMALVAVGVLMFMVSTPPGDEPAAVP